MKTNSFARGVLGTRPDLPLGSVCLMNAMEAFIGSVEGRTVAPPPGACSALAVRGTRSRTGEPIIARNFDYPQQVSVPTIDTFGCARFPPFGNGKPQKRADPATRERRKPWRRQAPPFSESVIHRESAFQTHKRQRTVLEGVWGKG